MSTTPSKSDLLLEREHSLDPVLIEHLQNTVFGTEGKLRYRQKEIERGMQSLKDLEFIKISKRDRILATAGVLKRRVQEFDSLYIRYLSALSPMGKSAPSLKKEVKAARPNSLRSQIADLFTHHFEQPFIEEDKTGCFYAYVESDNVYSQNLCHSFGFKAYREIQTLIFSRFSPKAQTEIQPVNTEERGLFEQKLQSFYKDHSFVFTQDLNDQGTLFAKQVDGNMIAGLRVKAVNWEIVDIPGYQGFLMQHILPYLPFTRRLFNPKNLQFLAIDAIWFESGQENNCIQLMEHVCAKYGIHMAMFWGDSDADWIQNILNHGKLGLLHKLNSKVTADVLIRPINLCDDKLTKLRNQPVFVSAMDMT